MKSSKTISFLLVLVLCAFSFVGCNNRTAVTTHDFESVLTEMGYNVNVSAPVNSPCVTSVARKDEYNIIFYEFLDGESDGSTDDNTVEYAQKIFESIKNDIDQREKTKEATVEVDASGLSSYSFMTQTQYYAVSRVDNTVLFASVPLNNKDAVVDVFEELGYI